MSEFPKCKHGYGDPNNLNPCPFCAADEVNDQLLAKIDELTLLRAEVETLRKDKERLDKLWSDTTVELMNARSALNTIRPQIVGFADQAAQIIEPKNNVFSKMVIAIDTGFGNEFSPRNPDNYARANQERQGKGET